MAHEIEEMAAFFDRRAAGYEDHMRGVLDVGAFYGAVAEALPQSGEPCRILDLGCGTGLELGFIFGRMPHARITGIDLSGAMLCILRETYRDKMDQITLIQDSYITYPLGERCYDYAVSVQSMHHYLPEEKTAIYRKVYNALNTGGAYAEGDFVVSEAESAEYFAAYQEAKAQGAGGLCHLDIPFMVERQEALLQAAGFRKVELLYHVGAAAVLRAWKE